MEQLQQAINIAVQLGYSYSQSGRRHIFEFGNVNKKGVIICSRLIFIEDNQLKLEAGATTINHGEKTIDELISALRHYRKTEICLN